MIKHNNNPIIFLRENIAGIIKIKKKMLKKKADLSPLKNIIGSIDIIIIKLKNLIYW